MTCKFKSYKLRVHLHPSFAVFAILGHYQWQGTKPVHTLRYTYDNTGSRLDVKSTIFSQWGGSDTTYALNIHEDIMGSSVAYTYQNGWNNGQWANKHEYDVWGFNTKAPTYNYDPMYRSTEPYYTGHPYDGSLNIYFAENRFYDAETGTWLSSDPIKDGLNWYTYCNANPTSIIDILGLSGLVVGDEVIEGVTKDTNDIYIPTNKVGAWIFDGSNMNGETTTEERFNLFNQITLSAKENPYISLTYFNKIQCAMGNQVDEYYLENYNIDFENRGYDLNLTSGVSQKNLNVKLISNDIEPIDLTDRIARILYEEHTTSMISQNAIAWVIFNRFSYRENSNLESIILEQNQFEVFYEPIENERYESSNPDTKSYSWAHALNTAAILVAICEEESLTKDEKVMIFEKIIPNPFKEDYESEEILNRITANNDPVDPYKVDAYLGYSVAESINVSKVEIGIGRLYNAFYEY